MTIAFKSWLPEEALRAGIVERTIRDAAHGWSEDWFARQFLRLLDTAGHPSGRPRDLGANWTCRNHVEGLAVAFTDLAGVALAGLMLDRNIENSTLRPADRLLLERLASRSIEDLCNRLSNAFGLDDGSWQQNSHIPAAQQEAHFYRLGLVTGSPLVHIGVDISAAVALIKAHAKATQAPRPLRSINTALTQQPVLISARLGQCNVSAADLAELVPGDVLVLDRDLARPLEIAVNGKLSQGQCSIEQVDSKLQVKILKSLAG